jgi:hypothetical protein
MLIIRESSQHGTVLPSILNVVRNLPARILSHQDHMALPPETIAFRAVRDVIKNFETTLTTLSAVGSYLKASDSKQHLDGHRLEGLADDYVSLLASITSFIEDCHHIFKVTMPYHQIDEAFVSKWLQKPNIRHLGNFSRM